MRQKGDREGVGERRQPKRALESIFCGLFPGSIAADCLTSRLTGIVIGRIYVRSTTTNIRPGDCSQLVPTKPLKRQACLMIE